MTITAMSLTNGTLTVIVDNGAQILTARNDHPRWAEIEAAFKAQDTTRLFTLLSMQAVVEEYSSGQLTINSTGVLYRGSPLHTVDADRVMAFLRDGLPYKPIANYIERKMKNPSARAISEMYSFLEHKNMPLTPEGKIIAYKGVQTNFYSVRGNTSTIVIQGVVNESGQILNEVGAVIEVERSSVDDNFKNGCSFGLHAGSLAYARGWGQRVVLVEIDPADVVSIPEDCSCQKLRCCKYKVIGEYTGPMPDTYTSEFSDEEETDICHKCGATDCNCAWPEDKAGSEPCSCSSNDCSECGAGVDTEGTEVFCKTCGATDCNCAWNPPEEPENGFSVSDTFDGGHVGDGTDEPCDPPKQGRCEGCTDCQCDKKESASNHVSKEDVTNRFRKVLEEQLGVDPITIGDNTTLLELGADSLDGIEIAMALEEEFQIPEISDEELAKVEKNTFSEMAELLYRKINSLTHPGVFTKEFDTCACGKNVEENDEHEDSYLKGLTDGLNDAQYYRTARFLAGDQEGADSPAHAKYIEGYLSGFGSVVS